MYEARVEYDLQLIQCDWKRTASLMALFANANRDPKKRSKPYTPNDFDPFGKRSRPAVGIEALKAFVPSK